MKCQGVVQSLVVAALLICSAVKGPAQGTAFTYQGRLNDGGIPVNGLYDFQFTIHSASSGVAPVSPTLVTNGVPVSNGLFTVTLDPGSGVFTGGRRWLAIELNTNGVPAPFVPLAPRPEITAAPYAVFAGNAAAADSVGIDAVTTPGLQEGAVTSEKIADGTVGAADLGGALLSNTFWRLNGNDNTAPGTHFIGTTDNQPLEFRVNGQRAFRLQMPTLGAPAVIGGSSNTVAANVSGGTIAGGYSNTLSSSAFESTISGGALNTVQSGAHQAAIGGGAFNAVGNNAGFATISGGRRNVIGADARNSNVAGGSNNTVNASYSAIGGGAENFVTGPTSVIAGGFLNSIHRDGGTIAGGIFNTVQATNGTVGGGRDNRVLQGLGGSTIAGGMNNFISDAQAGTIAGGVQNHITGSSATAVVGGGYQNFVEGGFAGVIAGGYFNLLTEALYGTIGGGYFNTNAGWYGTVPGGARNHVAGDYSLAAGRRAKAAHHGTFVWADRTDADFTSTSADQFNVRASGGVRFVTSGAGMSLDGPFSGNGSGMSNVNASSLGGIAASGFWRLGGNNVASGQFLGSTNTQPLELRVNNRRALRLERDGAEGGAHVFGGSRSNGIVGLGGGAIFSTTIGGGGSDASPNIVSDDFATVSGGAGNIAGNTNAAFDIQAPTVGGGQRNRATSSHAIVGGGINNVASGAASVVGGGSANSASGLFAAVAGGTNNSAQAESSAVGGGSNNDATGGWNTIGGGAGNTTSASHATVGGGWVNVASDHKATVGGGSFNVASGFHATVPGGANNTAAGDYSHAAGRQAKANHAGSFVWADDTAADFASTATKQFAVRANNGVMIQSTNTALDLRGGGAIRVAGAGVGTATPAFIHRATAANLNGHITYISHPLCDGDPNAILIVTPNYNPGGVVAGYVNHPIGVYYTSGRWSIFYQDLVAMAAGVAFNVLVIKP